MGYANEQTLEVRYRADDGELDPHDLSYLHDEIGEFLISGASVGEYQSIGHYAGRHVTFQIAAPDTFRIDAEYKPHLTALVMAPHATIN